MGVISVQSHVSFGHVGNSAAVFALRQMGLETWPVHTAMLAHHPGYGGFYGALSDAGVLRSIFAGLEGIGAFGRCSALLSGYLGSVENADAVLAAWEAIRGVAPDAVYCCNPVIGDSDEGIYVDAGLVSFFRDCALPKADMVSANAFEASVLSGIQVVDSRSAIEAGRVIIAKGPGITIISSVPLRDGGVDWLGNMLVDDAGAWLTRVPVLDRNVKGAGDFMTALWLGRYLQTRDSATALRFATAGTKYVVELVFNRQLDELPLVGTAEKWLDNHADVFLEKIE